MPSRGDGGEGREESGNGLVLRHLLSTVERTACTEEATADG